ncbi:amino acid ABC transporter substrate-binding protein [Desertifilum sp. FACHB-1129]|uniref:Receptor ligand binding family protein n=1 Tax=Desertifilum tharense IPPAS B-1220 TaxID=1781255 RepID=A0A1E5QLS3_9CYAN|nr:MULTISPECIES: ABC transporter substrate-binding protein [Desertifilum]MDA0212008.1 ABC transporter substrate-binding protein [Cyanobacteria bacterium FC1]MBD2313265.1 amino acid ABC transporter substrate-binding protein [Desertifilum sp. FACHB-1129]MBD2324274.1 amino acid ABC transporter substrate-binding protein [Desertifilum sp. FACHB-866]MBD2334289.1 amino acid ABC transporter substrate-binding protein [Desertifilum sp. FACHB-868]OEJ75578.1 receptor ligand binding family protein [Deserti
MSQKNETTTLVLALLITVGVVGGGLWVLANWLGMDLRGLVTGTPGEVSQPGGEVLISRGDRWLIPGTTSPQKQAAAEAIAAGNYAEAIAPLESALQASRNDPEALIYLNNARIGTQQAYSIAVVVPSSTQINAAKELLRGVAQAQENINRAGGINGVPLRVAIADDRNTPEMAQQVARSLVRDSEILGVVGHFSSPAMLAAAPIYQQGQLVVISPTSTSVRLSAVGNYIFRTVPSDRFAANALARHALSQLRVQRVGVFFNSASDYSQSLKDEFTTALFADGGQVVAEFDFASPTFNPGNAVESAIAQGAQAIMLAPDSPMVDRALQVVAVNRRRLPILAGDSIYTANTLQVGGDNAVGMVLSVPWHILGNQSAPFPREANQLWGGEVNWRTAMAYDATQAFVAGLQSNPSRAGIQQALSANNFNATGAAEAIRFQPSGDRAAAVQLVTIQPGTRTPYGFEFVPLRP